ncbi:methyltransferase domain-containing protein [Candidatus Methylospira mobilis]|uniref:protein-glutamate O-methyltransferase n=1 Tax=Candidatus Methylospira mobilis TaxID=1808979 RepID=A0A5Q0BHJ0_9GAMM|nr:CheR family methyltransferase [Candidatus Methylospira mobilis]QFY43293.1 methyltransferase domain-containing protein [Candidatus Methylospira mobilis]
MTGVSSPENITDTDEQAIRRIQRWLRTRSGMSYQDNKLILLANRLMRVCFQFDISGMTALAEQLESSNRNDVQIAVMNAASTNHTYFFREPEVLSFFELSILPTLPQNNVRIWSAAASTGDEAYTTAIQICERRGVAWASQNLAILGTDISANVVNQAEGGIYGENHVTHIPATWLGKPLDIGNYLAPAGLRQYRISDNIRPLCTFRRMNLTALPYPFQKKFHVVFCRNVLYYFDRATQHDVAEAIYDVTVPGGWLLTSVTVSLRDLKTRWVNIQPGVYRRGLGA